MKEFAKRIGIELFEIALILLVSILAMLFLLKAIEWFIGLWGYTL